MSRGVSPALVVAFGLTFLGIVGCAAGAPKSKSDSGHAMVAGSGGTGSGGAPATNSGDGGAPDTSGGKGGMAELNTDPNGDGGAPDQSCAADVSTAEAVPLDIYFMLDVSGSMLEGTSMYDGAGMPITKWAAIKTALQSFIEDDASKGLGVGIQYFPLIKATAPSSCTSDADCGDSAPCQFNFCYLTGAGCVTTADCGGSIFNPCVPAGECNGHLCVVGVDECPVDDPPAGGEGGEGGASASGFVPCTKLTTSVCQHTARCDTASYAEPAEAIAALPEAGPGLLASLDAQVVDPYSQTPTGPALSGALKQARTWALAHADHRVVAVLATDGLPNECSPSGIADLAKLAAAGLAATPSLNTFTIGIFSSAGLAKGQAALNSIASAGGTKAALIVDTSHDVASLFRDALDTIRATQLACEFKIPEPKASETLDYKQVNVDYRTGKKSSALYYVGNAEECDPLNGGWYYDTDPEVADPTRIVVCPTTCTTFRSATNASVEIGVGCQTIVK